MAISDIFSSSFLFSIATVILLVGGLFAYFNYRIAEQDHKLNAMVGLVTTMASESQFFRSKLNLLHQKMDQHGLLNDIHTIPLHLDETNNNNNTSRINVSDDEQSISDDEDEEDDDEDEDEDEDDDEDEDEDEDDSVSEQSDVDDNDDDNIKIINLSLSNEDIISSPIENIEDLQDNQEIKTIHLEEPLDISTINNSEVKVSSDDIDFLKSVSITDLGENDDNQSIKNEYKKLSLNKLREIVVSKGLINDPSKLKKNEILKLLGDE